MGRRGVLEASACAVWRCRFAEDVTCGAHGSWGVLEVMSWGRDGAACAEGALFRLLLLPARTQCMPRCPVRAVTPWA